MQQNNWFYRLPPAGTPSLLQKRGRVLIAGLPLRKKNNKTKEHKDKKINNMLLLFEKRRGTACGGGDEKTQAKKVKLPPPAGTPSLLQKRGRVLITGLPLRDIKQFVISNLV